jgi:hypothetical protein
VVQDHFELWVGNPKAGFNLMRDGPFRGHVRDLSVFEEPAQNRRKARGLLEVLA